MSIISIRLPEDVEQHLAREAQRLQRSKSEIARDAIVEYLRRLERDRFLAEIARAARSRGDDEAIELAEEALPLDNEAWTGSGEYGAVHEPEKKYRARRSKRR